MLGIWFVRLVRRELERSSSQRLETSSSSAPVAASDAVQAVDPNEVNELDRAAIGESSWLNYLLWMLGAALAVAFAMWGLFKNEIPVRPANRKCAEPLVK